MLFDLPKEESSIIKIIGVGGGGSNAVNHMYKQGIVGVDYAVCNTDAQALQLSPVPTKIQLGNSLTEGMGAGSKPDVGKRACLESIAEVTQFLENNTKMVFITAGMGGGTGTGAAPIIAKTARDMGILTVGIVTLPFSFEGRIRVTNGYEGLSELQKNVDCLVVVSNDKLRTIYGNQTITQAFANADNILCTAAKGIAEIITVPGYVNVDFEDVNTVMRDSGVAIMGTAAADGENRARVAVDQALNSPLLEDNNIRGAKNILVNITSGTREATMDEIFEITEFIQEEAGTGANLIWGNCYDERLGEKLAVTIIATGFEASEKRPSIPGVRQETRPSERRVHLDDSVKKTQPSLADVTADKTDNPATEERANGIPLQFEFDVRATSASSRSKSNTYDGLASPEQIEAAERERSERAKQLLRRVEEVRNRQLNLPKLSSPQNVIELESQPAYMRRGTQLDPLPDAQFPQMSNWSIQLDDEQAPEIKTTGNTFLHEKVD